MNVDRVLGLGAALLAVPVLLASWRYEVGTYRVPGAGFWPFYVALAMVGLGAILMARPAPAASSGEPGASRWRPFAIAVGTLVFYVVGLESLGYLVATAILLFVQLRWVEDRSWRGSLTIAAVSSAVSLVVFRTLLKVPLPVGLLPLPKGW
jgi:putative tricarboxylic transport membrane protein